MAILGAAFDPPHSGHLDLVDQLAERGFRHIMLVPSYAHPFSKSMSPFDLRLQMVRALVSEWQSSGRPRLRLEVSAIEQALAQPGEPVYTWTLLNALQQRHPEWRLHFVIGPDNLAAWERFRHSREIEQSFELTLVEERIACRSTLCRSLIARGEPAAEQLLSAGVLELVRRHRLYLQSEPA